MGKKHQSITDSCPARAKFPMRPGEKRFLGFF